jgi:hypothetical protein
MVDLKAISERIINGEASNVQKEEFKFDELDKLRAIDIMADVRTSNYAKVVNMMSLGLPENIDGKHAARKIFFHL